MATVTVTVLIPQNTPGGTIDHITFSVSESRTTASLSLNLKVITTIDSEVYNIDKSKTCNMNRFSFCIGRYITLY